MALSPADGHDTAMRGASLGAPPHPLAPRRGNRARASRGSLALSVGLHSAAAVVLVALHVGSPEQQAAALATVEVVLAPAESSPEPPTPADHYSLPAPTIDPASSNPAPAGPPASEETRPAPTLPPLAPAVLPSPAVASPPAARKSPPPVRIAPRVASHSELPTTAQGPVAPPTLPEPLAVAPAPVVSSLPRPPARPGPGWLAGVNAWLAAHLFYPETARRLGRQGTVVVRFTVERDGELSWFDRCDPHFPGLPALMP